MKNYLSRIHNLALNCLPFFAVSVLLIKPPPLQVNLQTRGEPSTWTPRGELVKAEASQILLGDLRAQDVQSSPRTMKIMLKPTEILEFSIATVQIVTI